MVRLALVAAALLGPLAGWAHAQTMDGQAGGRFTLELGGFLVAVLLVYVACCSAIIALFSRTRNPRERPVSHRGLSEIAQIYRRVPRHAALPQHGGAAQIESEESAAAQIN